MRKFDTKVQQLKYMVLCEVAREAWEGTLLDNVLDIPQKLLPGNTPTMRCCVYKERAILSERVKIAMGGDKNNKNVIEVIEIACDECPMCGYEVTDSCRGCISHRCKDVCKRKAITFDHNHVAHIDKKLCVDCGACAKVCPFTAIVNRIRPCQSACKVNAISMDENKAAKIDDEKCIACGACVYQCPFGAIADKSYILEVIDIIKKSENNTKYKVYALVAPSISTQFTYAKLGQVFSGIKSLGFYDIAEAALGADMVACEESRELAEKGILASSCCPAFVDYTQKIFPELVPYLSSNLSPMVTMAKYIKKLDPTAKVVFIGPCTAKKMEIQKEEIKPYVDSCITFEELQALFKSRTTNIISRPEETLDTASFFGRIFARSGGLTEAVAEGLKEHGFDSFDFKPVTCDGIDACRMALLKLSKNVLDGNFIEGMACSGGCIGGAGCLTHGDKNSAAVDRHGREAGEKTILGSVSSLK